MRRLLKIFGSAFIAVTILFGPEPIRAGDVLFVSDSATDSQNIPFVLSGGTAEVAHPSIPGARYRQAGSASDHNVTIIRNDYVVTGGTFGMAEGTNLVLAGLVPEVTLADYCSVFWSASGPHEPNGLDSDLGADGGLHNDPEVFTSLDAYVGAGGFVFVSGHDAGASPEDMLLAEFVGGPGAVMGEELRAPPNEPPLGSVSVVPGNALSTGVADITGASPGAVASGGVNVVDGVQDLDSVVFPNLAETAIIVAEPASPGTGMWTVRTPSGVANQAQFINVGHIAYVANGTFLFEDLPFNPGVFLSDGEDISWLDDEVYNAALRNFAANSCLSLPFDDSKTPVANNQSISTGLNLPIGIALTGSDPNADPITFSIDSGPTNGSLSGTEPNITYTPFADYFGGDSFTFVASDGSRSSNPATVDITVREYSFDDVPPDYWAFIFVQALARNGITAGCGGGNYCPNDAVTRAQVAVFLIRGMFGSTFNLPAATGDVFLDVAANDFAANFIEQLFLEGITGGCGSNNYCPSDAVTRAQMAVFLLRAKYGSTYSPPAPTGIFPDTPLGSFAVDWIEQLAAEGITSGCGGGNFCPNDAVTRAQMAVFLVRTFGL